MKKENVGSVKVIPLGGLEQIGMNITAIEYDDSIVVVDCGLSFPEEEMLGIDLIIPDVTYLKENIDKVKAFVITHGHEDHIGAIPYVLKEVNVPIYATRLTMGLIESKLKDHYMLRDVKRKVVRYGQSVTLGDFRVEFIRTNHSIADAAALAIFSPAGILVHTGDFKVDYTPVNGEPIDLQRFAELGKKGVLALMCDSTNALRPGFTMSERTVGSTFDKIFNDNKIDAVIHFAANSLVGESMTNPLKYYDNNLNGTKVLLQSMVAHGIDKIVFSSTAATYGEPERTPILETDPTNPTNCYGETKKSMERMFYWVEKAHGLRYVSLRYFNACGAHISGKIGEAHNPETHLIPIILQAAQGTRDHISIFGTDYPTSDGTCIRDYIHVTDLAQAHILAVEYLMKGGKSDIFNLGNGVGFSVREVIEKAKEVTQKDIKVVEESRRSGDPAVLIASSDKAKTVLGWKPEYDDLGTIIKTAWKWHSTHPNGYNK